MQTEGTNTLHLWKLPRVESLRRHPSFARPRPWRRFLLQSVSIPSMGRTVRIFTYKWLISMGNVGKYTIHGWCGYVFCLVLFGECVCVCALFKVSYISLLYSIWCIFGILSNMQTSGEVQPLPTCSGPVCALFQLPLQASNHVETFNLGSFMWTSIPSKLIYPLKIDTWIRYDKMEFK